MTNPASRFTRHELHFYSKSGYIYAVHRATGRAWKIDIDNQATRLDGGRYPTDAYHCGSADPSDMDDWTDAVNSAI